MAEHNYHVIGHTLLRITIGLLFLVAGIKKLMAPTDVSGMLGGLGFPAPVFFAWILILAEVIFGALILVGYKVRYTAWPLAFVLAVAWILVVIPSQQGITSSNSFFHLIGIAGLITIAWSGPGKFAVTKR